MNLVDMFRYAGSELTADVVQQKAFYEECSKMVPDTETPLPGEIEEAKRNPNGWVYRIAGSFGPNEHVPPEAIVGAWRVDHQGRIVDSFIVNKKYDPSRWPRKEV